MSWLKDLGISSVGNVAGGLLDFGFGGLSASRNWKYQKKAMELQQEYNLQNMSVQNQYAIDAFNRENEYNDPRNAAARFRAAGINPISALGNAGSGVGVAGSISTPGSSNPSASGNMDNSTYAPTMTLAEVAAMRNQKRMTDAEVKLKEAQAREADSRTTGQDNTNSIFGLLRSAAELENDNKALQNDILAIQKDYEQQKQEGNLSEIYSRITELLSRSGLNDETRANLISTRSLIKAQTETEGARKENIEAQTKTEGARKENIEADTDFKNSQRETEDSLRQGRFDEVQAKIDLLKKQARTEREREELAKLEVQLRRFENDNTTHGFGEFVYRLGKITRALIPISK